MSMTTSLSLNQDLSVSSLRQRTENSGAPDKAKQQAWLKAMEQSQMQEWLRQGWIASGSHDAHVVESRHKARDLNQTHHQDDVEWASDREPASDMQADSRSNGNDRPAPSNDVTDEKKQVTQDVKAGEILQAASSVQRWTAEPKSVAVENGGAPLSQQAHASNMPAFAKDSLAPSSGSMQSSLVKGSAIPMAREFAQIGQAVQTIKMALQEMTGVEARIVSAESLNQVMSVDKQISQPLSKLAASLATSVIDKLLPEISEINEESANAQAVDKEDSLPEEHETIRFHAEWSEEGLRLWLGIDSNANIDKAQLAKHLHDWAAKQNVQLLALVWNGEQLSRNVFAQMLKERDKPSVWAHANSKPGGAANGADVEDTHYFLKSYLETKEMQWPSVQ